MMEMTFDPVLFSIPSVHVLVGMAGVLTHLLYFIRGKQHTKQALRIILFYIAWTTAFSTFLVRRLGYHDGMRLSLTLCGVYGGSCFASIGVYRLFFHRTRHFPGPILCSLTKLYSGAWMNRWGKIHDEHLRVADKYGDFSRIAPNMVMIRHIDALAEIHGTQSKCTRASEYENVTFCGEPGLVSFLTREDHKIRKQVWDKALSPSAIRSYEEQGNRAIQEWLAKLTEVSTTGETVNVTLFALLMAFDTMGRVGFSKEFGLLAYGKHHRLLDLTQLLFRTISLVGFSWPVGVWRGLHLDPREWEVKRLVHNTLEERRQRTDNPNDVIRWFVEDFEAEKPKTFFNYNALQCEALAIFIASTDNGSATLGFAFNYLARDPALRENIRNELKSLAEKSSKFEAVDLAKLELLNAVINETLRLHPPGALVGTRLTPPDGLHVAGKWIPGETEVYTPPFIFHRCEKYFKHADQWIVERWTTRPELIIDKRAYFPFLMGPMACVGRRLALEQLRATIAYTLWNFDFSFGPGEDGSATVRLSKNWVIVRPGPLHLKFEKIVRENQSW